MSAAAAAPAPISPQHAPLTPPTTGSPGPVSPASSAAAAGPNDAAASAAGPARRKTSRRANTAERRATHNAVERQRRETLNGRFLDLAALLPNLASVRRPSKSAIVNSSIALIHTQRRARALAGRELRILKSEYDAVRRELNEWRDRANLPRVEEGPRSAEFQALMVLDDADEAGEDEVRRAYEMAAIPCGDDGDGLEYDGYDAQPVSAPPAPHADFHAQQQAAALHPQLHAAALHMQQQHQAALQQQHGQGPRPMSVHIPTQAHFDQQTAAQLFAEPAAMSPTADKVAAWQLLQHQQQQQQYHQQLQQQQYTPPPSSHGQRFAPYPAPPPQPVQFRSDDDASSVSSARSSGSPPTQTGQFDMPPTLAAGATPADFARFWAQPPQQAGAPFGQPKVGYPMGYAM